MKLAIVGSGNAGCITALHYHRFLDTSSVTDMIFPRNEIVIYHSPEKHPIERVGQGTLPSLCELIETLDHDNFTWYNNHIDATFKSGVLYEGWGKLNDKFFHPFGLHQMSMHFVPQKLSNAVIESGHFTVIEKTITDPEKEIDADIIFDCRGRHNRDKSNYETLINPLNSVLLYEKEGRDPDLIYTRTVATPNGWTFVIPNKDSVSYGYLYNDTITSKEDATEDFLERFNLPEIDGDLKFENYMAKSMFVGERTILNGNMFGFIEPMEATSLGLYEYICRQVWDCVFGVQSPEVSDNNVRRYMKETETFILWNYQYGSKYDTPFWEYAKSLPFEPDDVFKNILNDPNISRQRLSQGFPTQKYGQWVGWNMDIFKRNYETSLSK